MKFKNSIPLWLCLVILFSLAAGSTGRASGQAEPNWPRLNFEKVAGGLERPVSLTHAGDSSGRLFVVEQGGRIRIVKNGAIQSTFLNIIDRVRSPEMGDGNVGGAEEGLLSVAFPPGFGSDKDHFYAYYTFSFSANEGYNRVSRFYLGSNGLADPNSEELVILFEHPGRENHNGGQLVFGPDGYLYIGTGDGGGRGYPDQNAQDPLSLLGKMLRIDVESGASTYKVPTDNPFFGMPGYRPEIWALGLRNPWRISFDRQTGNMFIGDVGQSNWEEVDFQLSDSPGGENYGWNILEGTHCYEAATCDKSGMTPPVFEYPTHVADHCSVTGGYVYRGPLTALRAMYIFADLCSGEIWGLKKSGSVWFDQVLLDTDIVIPTFGEDQAGNVYFTGLDSGNLYRITEAKATFLPVIFR